MRTVTLVGIALLLILLGAAVAVGALQFAGPNRNASLQIGDPSPTPVKRTALPEPITRYKATFAIDQVQYGENRTRVSFSVRNGSDYMITFHPAAVTAVVDGIQYSPVGYTERDEPVVNEGGGGISLTPGENLNSFYLVYPALDPTSTLHLRFDPSLWDEAAQDTGPQIGTVQFEIHPQNR